ncbi:MAG: FtsQ-type POTRA domain-containing protein [Deltaproteobacteria bacterium]|nr:FtsQ-type POTRA domain-containing protein [Deltaproteobacteria bacterium]
MKKRTILSGQTVTRKKKNPKGLSGFFGAVKAVTSLSLKIMCLCIFVVSVSALFLYLYQFLISSPYMALEEVRISGVDDEIKRDLIDISGLDSEISLLTLNLNEIKQSMESHPWVRRVELEKCFPNLLLVRAEKETPYAIVALEKLYYINKWGEPFKEIEYSDNKDFPVITGISPENNDRDHYMKLAAGILSVFESDKGAWSMEDLSELHFEKNEKVSLYSTSIPVVLKMGFNEIAAKKKELKKILVHLNETGRIHMVKAIDLNYSDGVVVSFKDAG